MKIFMIADVNAEQDDYRRWDSNPVIDPEYGAYLTVEAAQVEIDRMMVPVEASYKRKYLAKCAERDEEYRLKKRVFASYLKEFNALLGAGLRTEDQRRKAPKKPIHKDFNFDARLRDDNGGYVLYEIVEAELHE